MLTVILVAAVIVFAMAIAKFTQEYMVAAIIMFASLTGVFIAVDAQDTPDAMLMAFVIVLIICGVLAIANRLRK